MILTKPTNDSVLDFAACDTTWRIGADSRRAAERALARVRELEGSLNAFDPASRVARLNAEGAIVDADVARLVRRAEEYRERTRGVFDIARGALEHALKAYLRGASDARPAPSLRARYRVEEDRVEASAPLDLNGLAKGYIVDEAHRALVAAGGRGFVDGGGDIAFPTGPVAIQSPYAPHERIGVLDTRWNVATSGNARRRRGDLDHVYDARDGRVGSRHDQVTVVARRDCMEADALATTLCAALLQEWEGVEALWIGEGTMRATEGFDAHVWHA